MPRGITGSGPYAGRKRPPKPSRSKKAAAAVAVAAVVATATAAVAAAQVLDTSADRPLGSVDVDSLAGEVLKRYALRAGVPPRDVEGLTEDRLRQNVKLTIANHFELLTEG
jgi:hypothetical protein